jgi:hypothetical protein
VIYARKESIFEFSQLDDCKDPDIIILEISDPNIENSEISISTTKKEKLKFRITERLKGACKESMPRIVPLFMVISMHIINGGARASEIQLGAKT